MFESRPLQWRVRVSRGVRGPAQAARNRVVGHSTPRRSLQGRPPAGVLGEGEDIRPPNVHRAERNTKPSLLGAHVLAPPTSPPT